MRPLRIVLVDDNAGLRAELRALLEANGDVSVIAEAGDGRELLALLEHTRPDAVLLDLSMPGMDGFGALRSLAERPRAVPVVVLTMHDDAPRVDRALALGAAGFVLKSARPEVIAGALRSAVDGGSVIEPSVARALLARHLVVAAPGAGSTTDFSPRQSQLLRSLANDLGNKDIAYQLGLAEVTVKGYLKDLYARIGVSSRAGAVAWALRNGVID